MDDDDRLIYNLLTLLQRLHDSLPPIRTSGRICGACGCLLSIADRHCPNCRYQLVNRSKDDG